MKIKWNVFFRLIGFMFIVLTFSKSLMYGFYTLVAFLVGPEIGYSIPLLAVLLINASGLALLFSFGRKDVKLIKKCCSKN